MVAHARKDLDGDGAVDAVLIVRQPSAENGNPCELLVLQQQAGALAVVARSHHVVECLYHQVARNAASLQDNLKVSRGEINYTNQAEKGTSVYQFDYSQARQAWFFREAINAYSRYNDSTDKVDLVREEASYPRATGWTTFDLFNPDGLEAAFVKNRKIMKWPGENVMAQFNECSALLSKTAVDAGITSPAELANLMGNATVETGGFRRMNESFAYSSADNVIGAVASADDRFTRKQIEAAVASGDPKEVAKVMYENRADLGNPEQGDGWKFHGRGYLQYTGRENYTRHGERFGVDLVNTESGGRAQNGR